MIVTKHPKGAIGHVVLQKDHADVAHQLAVAFGNRDFAPLAPRDLMEFIAMNHDRGWDAADADVSRDPRTGLPFNLVNTPLDALLATGPRSVDFNSGFHEYCGLLAAMHIWGLYHGRYGLSDKIVVDFLVGPARTKADAMLVVVKAKEQELLARLRANQEFRAYVEPAALMRNYKLLQFFDTLSLYFNEAAGVAGEGTHFLHVPKTEQTDVTIALTPLGDKIYRLSPFPFHGSTLEVRHRVHKVPVMNIDVDYRQVLAESETVTEVIKLVA